MTEYQFHWWPTGNAHAMHRTVSLLAETAIQGAALALRYFRQTGCDIEAPLAHLDLIDASGHAHMLMVEEVLEWLKDPRQRFFVHHECLEMLLAPPKSVSRT
jgi:hypothetical protein